MLEELAKKDKFWRQKALQICKDRDLADEIVQEMYLKFYNKNYTITDDFYIIATLRNLFISYKKKPTNAELIELQATETFELDDKEQEILQNLNWHEIELIEMNYNNSIRKIARELNCCHNFVRREIIKAKKRLRE